MAELQFNGANEEAMDDYSVIPAGVYNSQIVKSEIVETKAKNGSLLKLQFKVIDGQFKGRIVFGQYNISNPNPQAVEISRKQIKTLCDAVGKPNGFQDTNEIHNIPLEIKVGIKPANGPYPDQNEIKYYDTYSGEAAASGGAEPQTASPSSTGQKPDWA